MSEELHAGVIHLSDGLIREMLMDVLTIDSTDTQGILRDKGVCTLVHKRLLLPETCIVRYIFYQYMCRQWGIVLEGPELPLAVEGVELPQVTPFYQRSADGSNRLVRIDICQD
jgi:hypothetical protein